MVYSDSCPSCTAIKLRQNSFQFIVLDNRTGPWVLFKPLEGFSYDQTLPGEFEENLFETLEGFSECSAVLKDHRFGKCGYYSPDKTFGIDAADNKTIHGLQRGYHSVHGLELLFTLPEFSYIPCKHKQTAGRPVGVSYRGFRDIEYPAVRKLLVASQITAGEPGFPVGIRTIFRENGVF